ncbi:hypothetical protein K458DRAFT_414478 [Lentithecium fluviatile CBS 122367]|uniref:Uncharacterized protein n=1 Tax=Lentithecium fluviatile CBS 122367 TaxID=1168545 RepID=A0A6G1JE60_9PLEO|nr:hypothetical protein K458DRAFT_414478 [Lentithecium fluviatile CBS 122367]
MPPIPIHKNDPISSTAAKPSGITPQTADANPPSPTRTTPAAAPATTTSSASGPPAPQPGARPLAPTGSTHPPTSLPPAPQPGAAPGAGYTATHHVIETRLGAPPPQYNIPPPTDSQLSGRSTTTSMQASKPGPTTLNMGPAAPGTSPCQQEHAGGGLQPLPRSSPEGPPGYTQQAPDNTVYGTGIDAGANQEGVDGGVGGTAWNMLAKAGEALKKGEEAAWRAVRK